MTPKIAYIVVADKVLRDTTSKYSLIGIFDEINIPFNTDSVSLPTFVVFARILNTQGTRKVDIKIENNGVIFGSPITLESPEPFTKDSLYVSAEIQNLTFRNAGTYHIYISVDDNALEHSEEHSFMVKKLHATDN